MKTKVVFGVLFGLLTFVRTVSGQNILVNPGFESGGLDPWFHSHGVGSEDWNITDLDFHTGSFSATTVGPNAVMQVFDPIPVNDIAEVSFWIKQPYVSSSRNFFGVGYHFSPGGASYHSGFHKLTTGDWEFWDDTSFISGAGGYLTALCIDGGYYDIRTFVDDVRIVRKPFRPPAQRIVLDWESDVPVRVVSRRDSYGYVYYLVEDGTMPAVIMDETFRSNALQKVNQIFADSGIENVVITDNPTDEATVVYFTNPIDDRLLGYAYTGIDRWNRDLEGGVVVFIQGDAGIDGGTAAHEVGHALGLRHVNPGSEEDPSDISVMDYNWHNSERFVNTVSDIFDPGETHTHNPVYHLERYVDGISHETLIGQSIHPGSWDLPLSLPTWVEISLDEFGVPERILYDVYLLAGRSDDTMMILAHFDEISLLRLSESEFAIDEGDALRLVASSTLDGDLDTVLSIGEPYDGSNLFIWPVDGQLTAYLQMHLDSDPGYITISEVTVRGVVVPEPVTLMLLIFGSLVLVCSRKISC